MKNNITICSNLRSNFKKTWNSTTCDTTNRWISFFKTAIVRWLLSMKMLETVRAGLDTTLPRLHINITIQPHPQILLIWHSLSWFKFWKQPWLMFSALGQMVTFLVLMVLELIQPTLHISVTHLTVTPLFYQTHLSFGLGKKVEINIWVWRLVSPLFFNLWITKEHKTLPQRFQKSSSISWFKMISGLFHLPKGSFLWTLSQSFLQCGCELDYELTLQSTKIFSRITIEILMKQRNQDRWQSPVDLGMPTTPIISVFWLCTVCSWWRIRTCIREGLFWNTWKQLQQYLKEVRKVEGCRTCRRLLRHIMQVLISSITLNPCPATLLLLVFFSALC